MSNLRDEVDRKLLPEGGLTHGLCRVLPCGVAGRG
jgi:hypothetical protein